MSDIPELNNSRFLERLVRTILLYRAQSSGRYDNIDRFFQFRDINALFLKIRITANNAARIELGGAGSVRITTAGN